MPESSGLFRHYDNLAPLADANALGSNFGVFGQGQVYDAPLKCRHRLQREWHSLRRNLFGHALCQSAKGLKASLAVTIDIND